MTVLDLSNYDWETFDAACLKESGCTGVIVGAQNINIADKMAADLQANDIPVIGFYGLVYFGNTAADWQDIVDACRLAKSFGVKRVWVDAEVDVVGQDPTPEARIAQTQIAVSYIEGEGLEAGIYTGEWFWVPQMANTTQFSRLPLWNSSYWDDGREIRTVDYGGWTDVAIHQWTSTYEICGRKRDANYVFETQEDSMTPAERAEFDALKAQVALIDSGQIAGADGQGYLVLDSINSLNAKVLELESGGVTSTGGTFKVSGTLKLEEE